MEKVTAQDFQKNFGTYQDHAIRQPVIITKHGKERLVLMSYEDYIELSRSTRQALHVTELDDEHLQAILSSKVPDEYAHLDTELEVE